MAKRRLDSHWRNNPRRDPNSNPEKVLTGEIAGEAVHRNHKGKMPVHVDDKKVKGEDPGEATTGIRARPGNMVE